MNYLARKITLFFIKKNAINQKEYDVYVYCFEILFSVLINFSILFVGMLITKQYIETLFFGMTFILIRKYIGGYHSKTHLGCTMLLILMYSIFIFLIFICDIKKINLIIILLNFFSLIFICLYAPVIHPNNPISLERQELMNKLAILFATLLIFLLVILFYVMPYFKIIFAIGFPIFFSTNCMLIGKLKYKK